MPIEPEAVALAAHLDAINDRVASVGPTSDAAARMKAVMAAHEAACSALRRVEAEAEIDGDRGATPAEAL